jgi:alkanesulfonate monooxygenase SsuD/methylene tetrahydromethanopterin reductase-like flavin-dependent oxidoreductase (luciferase family)
VQYAIDLSSVGPWGSPRTLADLAATAEHAGWDAVFLEDYVVYADGLDTYDPWVALAAIAGATERIRIGTLVTPLPRRRPWKVAAEAMTLDHLSGGRMILGVGSGDPKAADMMPVGEQPDARVRGAMLDEGLDVIAALWTGDPVHHHGEHYRLDGVALRPRPVQQPRIPIWVGGQYTRRRPRERALRWDGSCLYRAEPPDWVDMTPDDVHELRRRASERPDGGAGFTITIGGRARGDDLEAERSYIASIAEAGADWWNEWVPPQTPVARVRELISAGPLRGA